MESHFNISGGKSLRKVLIVDDIAINRMVLRNILKVNYDVLEADDGEKALKIIEEVGRELSAILLDIVMPVMDGYTLLTRLKADAELAQIPVIVTTGNTEGDSEIRALTLGANDFIAKPYVADIILRRLENTINLRETAAVVNALQTDALTGLYSREAFFRKAEQMIAEREPGYYMICCFDINNFKVINDQYGTAMGDTVLKYVAKTFQDGFSQIGGLVSRIMADNFAVIYPAEYAESKLVANMRVAASMPDPTLPAISFSIGRYLVNDLSLPVSAMYDRAAIAESSIKGRFDVEVAVYDESMRENILREQEIVDDMKRALDEREFEVWLQPQYNHSSGALVGAEALVRWRHPAKGLISPGVFIPVFERNGFIYELDKYVWAETCALLRKWLDEGREPLPVSVNISRYDVFREDLIRVITDTVAEHGVPIDLFRLEITESAFAKSSDQIISVVRSLINFGFTVEIDDFGSGYSSLNTLKDVPAQIVKLDMRFLDDKNTDRGGNILESVVRMAKWLGMSVIAEGVETLEQADYLRSIGCNYVQGYLYARPMSADKYEQLASIVIIENKLSALETVENLDNNSFWKPESIDSLIFNSYVGGACIFEYHNGKIELLRATQKYAQVIGSAGMTIEDALRLDWSRHLDESNMRTLITDIQRSIDNRDEVISEYVFENLPGCPPKTYLRSTLRVIAVAGDRYLIYCTNENITEQRETEIREREMAERLNVIMASIDGGVTAAEMVNGAPRLIFANDRYYEQIGYTRAQYEERKKLPGELVLEEDHDTVVAAMRRAEATGERAGVLYRKFRRDGSIMWANSNISVISLPGISNPVLLTVTSDVTAQIESERNERRAIEQLQIIMDNVGCGITAVVVEGDKVDYLFANDRFYELHGYTRENYHQFVESGFDIIHPDDRARIEKGVTEVNYVGGSGAFEYRITRGDGEIRWISAIITIRVFENESRPVQFTVYNDITAEKTAEAKLKETAEQLMFLNETASDLLATTNPDEGINIVLEKVRAYFGASRAFIYEYYYDKGVCENTYAAGDGDIINSEVGNSLEIKYCKYWLDTFAASDFMRYDSAEPNEGLSDFESNVYVSMGVNSALAVALRAGGNLIGNMGVDNPTRHIADYKDLKALGDYMAVMLTRRDLAAQMENDRENLRVMMQDTPGAFVRMRVERDGKLNAVFANDNYLKLRGVDKINALEAMKGRAENAIHPEDIEKLTEYVLDMLKTGETRSIQFRLKRVRGGYVPVNAFSRVTTDFEGERYLNVYLTDLTKAEKRENALREIMPHMFAAIMDYSQDLVFAKDKDFNYIYCSPAFVKFTRQRTQEDVIGKNDYDFWTKEEADHFRGDDMLLYESGEPLVDYIEPIPSDDGIQHYCRTSKYIIRDSEGEIIGMYGIGHDITDERAASEQLQLLANSIPGGIASYSYTPEGIKMQYFNDGYCDMLGYTREEYAELTADGIMNITFPDDIARINAGIRALVDEGKPFDEIYRVYKKDGGYKWVNSMASVSERVGDKCTINVVLLDYTKDMRAQEEQRIRVEEMRLAMSQLGKTICEYDPRDKILTIPESLAKRYGVPPTVENVPESVIAAGLVSEDTREAYSEFYKAILRGDQSGGAEYKDLYVDGNYRWQKVDFWNIFDSDGNPFTTLITIEDTTEERRKFELEQNRPNMGEESLLMRALVNLTTGEVLEYLYGDGTPVPHARRAAFGYEEGLDTVIIDDVERMNYRAINDPESLIARFREGERELTFEYRRRVRSGDIIWVRNILRMLQKPGGSDVLLFAYCYDIEREKTRELMYGALVDECFDYVARINGRTRKFEIIANTGSHYSMPPLSGDDIDAAFAEIVETYIHPDDRDIALDNLTVEGIKRNLAFDDRYRFTYRSLQPDGLIRHKRVTEYYLDKARDIIILTREDITDVVRKEIIKNEQLERALRLASEENRVKERESAAQIEAIINNVNGGTSAATLIDGVIGYIYVNDEYYSMFGYTREQFHNELPDGLFNIMHPDDIKVVEKAVEDSMKYGKTQFEFRVKKRDGEWIWVRSKSSTCNIAGIHAPVHIAVLNDMTKEKQAADMLRMSEEQFRIAASIGGRLISRYDIKTETYYHNDETLLALGFDNVVRNAPQAFVDAGNVRPDFIEAYLEFYDKIKRGEQDCRLDVMLKVVDGSFRWHHHEATVILDSDGAPTQAIVVLSDINDQLEKEAVYRKWRQSLAYRADSEYSLVRANLSRDTAFDSVEGALFHVDFPPEALSFTQRVRCFAELHVLESDREKFIAFMNTGSLRADYYRGLRTKLLEFRGKSAGETARWLKLTVELVEYPSSSDIEAYMMFENIDAKKRDELKNIEMAKTDPLTGALNRNAFIEEVEALIKDEATTSLAIMMLDIDGFKSINDTYGHTRGDKALIDIARALVGVLRPCDIVSRFGGDEFILCLKNMPTDNAIAGKARQICAALAALPDIETHTSVSIGIAVSPRDGADFETLYRKVDAALYDVKNHGRNGYAFWGNGE